MLQQTPGAVGAQTLGDFVDADGSHLDHSANFVPADGWATDPRTRVAEMMEWCYRDGRTAMVTLLGLWRTETLRAVRPLGSYYGSDWVLCVELAARGSIEVVREPLATYRRHEASSSSTAAALASEVQQRHFNPESPGRLPTWWNRRQRHAELAVAIAISPLPVAARARLLVRLLRHHAVVGAWGARRRAMALLPRRPRSAEDAHALL